MKKLLLFTLVLTACGASEKVVAPQPPPVAPPPPAPPSPPAEPADPAPKTDGDVTEATVRGMGILVKRIPGAEITATHLYVRGGVRNWGKDDAGIETLLMHTSSSGGTAKLDKDAFAHRLAELGSTVQADSGSDWSQIAASSLTPRWDETFELLVDAFRRPALPPAEIEIVRQRQLATLKQEQDDPDTKLAYLMNTTVFQDHPYGNRPAGTADSLAKLDEAALRKHHDKLQETSRLLLVVVGDVEPGHVVEAVRKGFGDMPRGAYQDTPLPAWAFPKATMHVAEQKLPTNYMIGVFGAPGWRDPDHAAALVAMFKLHRRVWEAVRTKRNLSYAPRAWYVPSGMPRAVIYVTAVDPKATWPVMLDEVRRFRNEPLTQKEVEGAKATMLSSYFVENESSDGQAGMLARAQLLGGDWRLARTLKERVEAVTPADVQAFAKKNIDKLQVFVLGDPRLVDEKLLLAPL
jgi:zinc protease